METHLLSKISNALCRCSFISWDTFSPKWARQSSIELSGLAGLNTGEVWQSNPVVVNAERKSIQNKVNIHMSNLKFLIPTVKHNSRNGGRNHNSIVKVCYEEILVKQVFSKYILEVVLKNHRWHWATFPPLALISQLYLNQQVKRLCNCSQL